MSKVKVSLLCGMVAGLLGGSAVAVTAQEGGVDPMAPAFITGQMSFAPSCVTPLAESDGDVQRGYGYRCEPQSWESDDERLGGEATVAWNADVHTVDSRRFSIIASAWEIRGEDGGWLCDHSDGLDIGSGLFTGSIQGTDRLTCAGTGANAGLSAILIADWSTSPKSFEGLIFPGTVPPLPDPSAK